MLELAHFPVSALTFGAATRYRGGNLTVDRSELERLLGDDPRLAKVEVHLALPGAATRIVHVIDVVEPRVKVAGGVDDFPGLLAPLQLAGHGRTHALKGMAVVVTADIHNAQEGVIDMTGAGAEFSKFGRTLNVVLVPKAAPGVDEVEFVKAILTMKLKAAVYLARPTAAQEPVLVESFDLPPLTDLRGTQRSGVSLPRIVHIDYLQSRGFGRERLFYGISMRGSMPTLAHPSEILDGALVYNGHTSPSKSVTYNHQNNAVMRALYARHGHDLLFAGVVLANHHSELENKEHTALTAARMAKQILGADAAIITKDGGGQADVDLMLCCTRCGELGLPTVLIAKEEAGAAGDFPLIATSPYADAAVSMGNGAEKLTLTQRVDRVLGGASLYDGQDALSTALHLHINTLPGATDTQGGVNLMSALF